MVKPPSFGSFFLSQWTPLGPPFYADLAEKTVVIIGANTGIGLEAAKHLAKMKPARLIIGARSEERGRTAIETIAREANYGAEIRLIDLADFSSVIAFAEQLGDVPIDILVANAAVANLTYGLTKDGWEQMLQVNHLATSLVALLLLPNLVRAGKEKHTTSRLVITSSERHMTIPIDKLAATSNILRGMNNASNAFLGGYRYQETKLLNVYFIRALASRLQPNTPVIAAVVSPGYCVSELRRSAPVRVLMTLKAMDIVMGRTSEQGARNLLWAALGPDGKDGPHLRYMQGAYVSTVSVREPGDNVISKEGYELQERIWRETLDILGKVAPTLRSVVGQYLQ